MHQGGADVEHVAGAPRHAGGHPVVVGGARQAAQVVRVARGVAHAAVDVREGQTREGRGPAEEVGAGRDGRDVAGPRRHARRPVVALEFDDGGVAVRPETAPRPVRVAQRHDAVAVRHSTVAVACAESPPAVIS